MYSPRVKICCIGSIEELELAVSYGANAIGLVSQMRRASVSIPANIAEGFKRRGIQDKIRFYNTAESSLEELKYFFILSKDLQYVDDNVNLLKQTETVGRLLNGFINSTEEICRSMDENRNLQEIKVLHAQSAKNLSLQFQR